MDTEIEVKFVNVDHDEVREKLRQIGGVCEIPMRTMRRCAFDSDFMRDGKDAFVRVRDEGDVVTMTYKQYDSQTLHGTKEVEITAGDYQKAIEILKQAGLSASTFQETRRENWRLDNVEVVLDEWPWLKPYIEIEGHDEESVRRVADLLEFDWGEGVFGDVMAAYRVQYPHLSLTDTIATIPNVQFGDPLPDILRTSE